MNPGQKIILFDGVCNLCNSAVNFIIDRDVNNRFVFAPLQSAIGSQLLEAHQLPPTFLNSLILVEQDRVYQKSTAALRIAKELRFPWSLCYVFIGVPAFVRDFVYQLIARYRYRLFGKSDTCRYPSDEIKSKFLVDLT